jgi:hypothetical protein
MTTTLSFSTSVSETLSGSSYSIAVGNDGFDTSNVALDLTAPKATFTSDTVSGNVITDAYANQTVTFGNLAVDNMYVGYDASATFSGTQLNNDGQITETNNAHITVDAVLGGTGMSFLENGGFMTLADKVGSGQSFDLGVGSSLSINDPSQFSGHMAAVASDFSLTLAGINDATSYAFSGSELTLYNGSKAVDKLSFSDPNGGAFGVYQTASGIAIGNGPADSGTAIPVHT